MFFIILDVGLGFYQEYKSNNTAKLLAKFNEYLSTVVRNGHKVQVVHEDLVPGDIIELKAGDLIPADIKIFDSNDLFVNESTLSGESRPQFKCLHQEKNCDPILYSGTTVIKGFGRGIVVYTGKDSRIGHISKLSTETEGESVYEKETKKLSHLIFKIVALALTISIFANYIYKFDTLIKFILFAISLAVTVIPEALPLVITFSLSNGALSLFKKKVLVKRLTSIEDLGGIEILCTDKTGTLTENSLKVANKISFKKNSLEKIAYMSVSSTGVLDSFDKAIREETGLDFKFDLLTEIPFDPVRKRSANLVKHNSKTYLVIKGAYEVISQFDHLTTQERKDLDTFEIEESKKGNRTLIFGFKELEEETFTEYDEKDITICGAFAFEDPIKFSTYHAIKKAQDLNLQIRVLTGDSKAISYYVSEKLGIISSESEVICSSDLKKLKGDKLREAIFNAKVYCRVSPEEKYMIIKTLQSKHLVGYLGDGINDAPALKLANVGVAVQNSSDIARSSADIILTNKNLEILVDGVLEGRKIFSNITKYIRITISSNFGNFFALLTSSFFITFLPLKPIQILLLNFVSDVPLMTVSTDNVDTEELKKPSRSDFSSLIRITFLMGFISSLFDFFVFLYFRSFGEQVLQSSWFLTSVLTEILIIFSLRSTLPFFKSKEPSFTLAIMAIVVAFSSIIAVMSPLVNHYLGFVSLSVNNLLVIISISLVYFLLSEIIKAFFYSKINLK
jgi:Mg2+-importing ATPase